VLGQSEPTDCIGSQVLREVVDGVFENLRHVFGILSALSRHLQDIEQPSLIGVIGEAIAKEFL
jgi:hypothetical protein